MALPTEQGHRRRSPPCRAVARVPPAPPKPPPPYLLLQSIPKAAARLEGGYHRHEHDPLLAGGLSNDFVSIWNPSPARLPRPPSHPRGATRSGSSSSPSPSHASAGSGTELVEKVSVVGSAARVSAARCGLAILLGIGEIRSAI
ncbi:hypothetical protein ACQJBY_059331 [Aegilops geniculata]